MTASAPKPTNIARWAQLQAWAQSTFYGVGDRVLANGNLYQCTQAGTSSNAGAGPAGMGGAIGDGTCVWAFQNVASTAWAPTTAYSVGARVTSNGQLWQCLLAGNSTTNPPGGPALPSAWMGTTTYVVGNRVSNNGNYYVCSVAGTSASIGGPGGTGASIPDGSVTWSYISTIASGIVDGTVVWLWLSAANAVLAQPPAAFADTGWVFGQRPPAEWWDWLDYTRYQWAQYLQSLDQGGWTWKQFQVDNTGNQAAALPSGALMKVAGGSADFEGASGDANPARTMNTIPVNRKLIDQWIVSAGVFNPVYVRVWAEGFAGYSITINANWNAGTSRWFYDDIAGDTAVLWRIALGAVISHSFYQGANNWTDTAFTTSATSYTMAPAVNGSDNNFLSLVGGILASSYMQSQYWVSSLSHVGSGVGPNACPPVSPGTLYKEGVIIAWGVFDNNGVNGQQTITRGYNISAIQRTAQGKVTVTLRTGAPTGLVPVVMRLDDGAPGMVRIKEGSMAANSFEIWSEIYQMGASTVAGTALNVAFVDQNCAFVVFGY